MSDLNQLVRRIKASGLKDTNEARELIPVYIKQYEESQGGPVCCFYVCKFGEIPYGSRFKDFRNHATERNELIIGCSRGCLPAKQVRQNRALYRKQLCDGCVNDAKAVMKDGS